MTAPISDNAGKEDKIPDVSGASSGNDVISSDHSYISKATENPEEDENIHASDKHFRETNLMTDEEQPDENPVNYEDDKTEDEATTGKTYYYKYFKPYSHDYRRLRMEEECQCPKGVLHSTKCTWYDPDTIYILDTQGDLSPSEQAAQQKIYHQYLDTFNNQPEQCGCGTTAKIAYIGHHTGCIEFQCVHERESFEVLLAILKKRRKVTFSGHTNIQTKRLRLETMNENQPKAKEIPSNLSLPNSTTDSLSMLADTALNSANYTQSNALPNSLSELVEDGNDCPCNDEDDEEMAALEDAD